MKLEAGVSHLSGLVHMESQAAPEEELQEDVWRERFALRKMLTQFVGVGESNIHRAGGQCQQELLLSGGGTPSYSGSGGKKCNMKAEI